MNYYEKHPNGEPLSTGNFDYRAIGYNGFLGFGQDLDGNCCGTENDLDCICDDNCEETDCVKWHGNIPGSASIVGSDTGLEPGGTFSGNMQEAPFAEWTGSGKCPEWMPHKLTKIPHNGEQIWWLDATELRDVPWYLNDCYTPAQRQQKQYLPPPCEEHVHINEDGSLDVTQPGLETPIGTQFYIDLDRPGSCNNLDEFFYLRVTLRFISSTINSCGVNCTQITNGNENCGYTSGCICTPNAGQLMLEIAGGAQFVGERMNCGEPARPEFNQEAREPELACFNTTFGIVASLPYDPQQTEYKIYEYTGNPSPCWSNVYSSDPCDYSREITINMVPNPNIS